MSTLQVANIVFKDDTAGTRIQYDAANNGILIFANNNLILNINPISNSVNVTTNLIVDNTVTITGTSTYTVNFDTTASLPSGNTTEAPIILTDSNLNNIRNKTIPFSSNVITNVANNIGTLEFDSRHLYLSTSSNQKRSLVHTYSLQLLNEEHTISTNEYLFPNNFYNTSNSTSRKTYEIDSFIILRKRAFANSSFSLNFDLNYANGSNNYTNVTEGSSGIYHIYPGLGADTVGESYQVKSCTGWFMYPNTLDLPASQPNLYSAIDATSNNNVMHAYRIKGHITFGSNGYFNIKATSNSLIDNYQTMPGSYLKIGLISSNNYSANQTVTYGGNYAIIRGNFT